MAQVKMYTTPWCGFCHAAKRLFNGKGVAYEDIDVDGDHETRAWLREVTGQHTVPQIFINGESIGGFTDAQALDRSGELDRLLNQP
ncbi:MAG: glutaredoxin [Myxococcales bacterium]|nr:glutaredoxin [Myxococcales bacterium]